MKNNAPEWRPFFAWRPVYVCHGRNDPRATIVWLEWVSRKRALPNEGHSRFSIYTYKWPNELREIKEYLDSTITIHTSYGG